MKAVRAIGAICITVGAGLALFVFPARFQNPALTETQLFLEYWPLWLAVVVLVLVGSVCLRWPE